jgi:hypothetical protein
MHNGGHSQYNPLIDSQCVTYLNQPFYCRGKYRYSRSGALPQGHESSYPHFIESSFTLQKEGKCCFIIIDSKGNAFSDSCQCVRSILTFPKIVLVLSD